MDLAVLEKGPFEQADPVAEEEDVGRGRNLKMASLEEDRAGTLLALNSCRLDGLLASSDPPPGEHLGLRDTVGAAGVQRD